MKKRSLFPVILAVLLLPCMLYFTIMLIYVNQSDKPIEPALDISSLPRATHLYVDSSVYPHISIDGVEYAPYASLDADGSNMDLSEIGDVFAFFMSDGGKYCTYFSGLKGLAREDWIIDFYDDGTGIPSQSTLSTIYKGIHVEEIPEQILRIPVREYYK